MSQLWRAASRRESRGPGTERLWKPSEFTVIRPGGWRTSRSAATDQRRRLRLEWAASLRIDASIDDDVRQRRVAGEDSMEIFALFWQRN